MESTLVFLGVGAVGKAVAYGHVGRAVKDGLAEGFGRLGGIGVVAVDHQVAIGVDVAKHLAAHVALSLAGLKADRGAVLGGTVRFEPRQGKGNVCRQMFRDIDADCYLMVDGDDTYPAEAAKALCEPILNGTADMTVGDRLSNGTYAEENKRAFHGFGNNLVRAMIKWIYGYSFDDVMTGYRAMSRPFVKTFPVLSEGFQIETELSIHAVDHRWRIKDVPIEYRDRPEGSESKLNTVSDGIKVVAMIGTLFKDYRPLKFFSLVALLFAVIGLALGTPIVVEYFQTGLVPRFPTAMLAASFMFPCGLSLATGFILDSVAKVEKKQWEVNVYSKYAYDDQPGRSATTPSE